MCSDAGGGAFGFKRVKLVQGQRISFTVGGGGADVNTNPSDGVDDGGTVPEGGVLTAGGRKNGVHGGSPRTGGLGAVSSAAWDAERTRGAGGNGVTGAATAGGSPTGGGAGGPGSTNNKGGGGAPAGYTDTVSGLPVGNGKTAGSAADEATSSTGGTFGEASSAGTFAGHDGRVMIIVVQGRA